MGDLTACRICGVVGGVSGAISVPIPVDDELAAKLTACAAVRVERGDGLPERVCEPCAADLERAYDFKLRCERSDALFRESLGLRATADFVLIDCDADFDTTDEDRPRRERRRRKSKRREYECDVCDRSFPYPSVLKLHAATHAREKTHKCIACADAFSSSKQLYAHYKIAHPSEPPQRSDPAREAPANFACTLCDKVFTQPKNLKVHEAMHAREKKYKCEGCSLGFTNMSILNGHVKREHPALTPTLSCEHCNRSFKKRTSYERHLDNHSKEVGIGDTERKRTPRTKDLFRSIAPMTTTHWSDSFSD